MILKSLEVENFRNLHSQRLEFSPGVNVFYGDNGGGKTSLLEAIYLLSNHRSFRPGDISDLCNWSYQERICEVKGKVQREFGNLEIGFSLCSGKRSAFVNGNRVSLPGFYGNLNTVVFTPDESSLIRGGPMERRSFLDRLLAMFDSCYVEHFSHYRQALKNRNALLLRGCSSYAELYPWDCLLVEHGMYLFKSREGLLRELSQKIGSQYEKIAPQTAEGVEIKLSSDFELEQESLDRDSLLKKYQNNFSRDSKFKTTRFGPQRDDLKISLSLAGLSKPARLAASQGQARSLSLALKLSALLLLREKTGETPVLLLDDVEAELDENRRRALYEVVKELSAQTFITGTSFLSESFLTESLNQNLSQIEGFSGPVQALRVRQGRVE